MYSEKLAERTSLSLSLSLSSLSLSLSLSLGGKAVQCPAPLELYLWLLAVWLVPGGKGAMGALSCRGQGRGVGRGGKRLGARWTGQVEEWGWVGAGMVKLEMQVMHGMTVIEMTVFYMLQYLVHV